jgi:hypothetical protein
MHRLWTRSRSAPPIWSRTCVTSTQRRSFCSTTGLPLPLQKADIDGSICYSRMFFPAPGCANTRLRLWILGHCRAPLPMSLRRPITSAFHSCLAAGADPKKTKIKSLQQSLYGFRGLPRIGYGWARRGIRLSGLSWCIRYPGCQRRPPWRIRRPGTSMPYYRFPEALSID